MNFLNKRITALPKGLLYISRITRMELLAKPEYKTDTAAEQAALDFINEMTIVPITAEIEDTAIRLRRENTAIKLPDALIAATALFLGVMLVSCDSRLVTQVNSQIPSLYAVYKQPLPIAESLSPRPCASA
jgi:predicted nucleic acid-binding protein